MPSLKRGHAKNTMTNEREGFLISNNVSQEISEDICSMHMSGCHVKCGNQNLAGMICSLRYKNHYINV